MKMTVLRSYVFVSFIYVHYFAAVKSFNSFMDNVYFDIKWAGSEEALKTSEDVLLMNAESVIVTTNNNEKYRCILPTVLEREQKEPDQTTSVLIELDLLKPLFEQSACTYRLETYWTYELCHGKHLRQYHEEKEMGKKPKIQEYFLGHYKMDKFRADYEAAKKAQMNSDQKPGDSLKIQKVQGIEIPYYEIVYTDGTICDLNGKPRKAHMHYVCEPDGRGEIYELKETSSCEYEVVVLSSQLCSHPVYGPKKELSNTINCHSLGKSPKRPLNLDLLELENTFEQFNSRQDDEPIMNLWDLVGQIIKEHHNFHHGESFEPDDSSSSKRKTSSESSQDRQHLHPPTDNQILKEFLEGSFCIEGGTGWWKHKFCFGRQVVQYHTDSTRRDTIVLGEWNEAAHLKWIEANPGKRPKPLSERKQINQFYSNGDVCDLTGQRRSVEVKLRCISNPVHPNAVAIYLNEPRVCEYNLVVESSVLCELITQVDHNGVLKSPKL